MTSATYIDSQVDLSEPQTEIDQQQSGWLRWILQFTSFSELLRIFGACAVLASMSLFLMNGWSEVNDIQRYLKLLAQTGLLTAGGVALSWGLKEFKGARLFYGLSLVSVAANFTILGALIYSMVQWDGALQDYPVALTWKAVEFSAFWPMFGGAAVLLALLSRFSFSIFARNHAGHLCGVYLLLSAGLLLPIRDSLGISVVIAIATAIATVVARGVRRKENFVSTPEANFALLTLFIPPAIMLVRAVSLYHVDAVLSILMSGLALVALRAQSLQPGIRAAEKLSGMQRISALLQFLLAVNIAFSAADLVPHMNHSLALATLVVATYSLTTEFVFSNRHRDARRFYLGWSMSFLLIVTLAGSLISNDLSFKIIGLLTAVACYGLSHLARSQMETKFPMLLSATGFAVQAILFFMHVVNVLQLNDWVLLGLAGGALIFAASIFERYGYKLAK